VTKSGAASIAEALSGDTKTSKAPNNEETSFEKVTTPPHEYSGLGVVDAHHEPRAR
jgi:hypothetical protein